MSMQRYRSHDLLLQLTVSDSGDSCIFERRYDRNHSFESGLTLRAKKNGSSWFVDPSSVRFANQVASEIGKVSADMKEIIIEPDYAIIKIIGKIDLLGRPFVFNAYNWIDEFPFNLGGELDLIED